MSTATLLPALSERPSNGGAPARRAVSVWAWRLFRREWRQQLLILALIVVAVAATVVGAAVATNNPPSPRSGFGTAGDMATFQTPDPHLHTQLAELAHRYGPVEVIENETFTIPGTASTYTLRAQDPNGPFGKPMLALLSGRYPTAADEVAITPGVASAFNARVGDTFTVGGVPRHVVGTVQNPYSLLDEFALVLPGQVKSPTQVTALFDAPGVAASSIGPNVTTPGLAGSNSTLNPETITLALATLGMLLIALVAVGGFTVLAQRRMRSLGTLASVGGTPKHVGLVVRANGLVVGILGTVIGFVLGLVLWIAYRPSLEQSSHHLIGEFALPWVVIGPAMALAIIATYLAAARPAHVIAKVPIVAALSGRPTPPKQVHRSMIPGIVCFVIAFFLLSYAGSAGGANPPAWALVFGLVALVPGVILLSPFFLTLLARIGRRAPIGTRLALRDLARYRARSGSALAAISLGVMVAVIIALAAAARYGNTLDYAGPNLASNQMIVYTSSNSSPPPGSVQINPNGGGPNSGNSGILANPGSSAAAPSMATQQKTASEIAKLIGSKDMIELLTNSASLNHAAAGRNFNGTLFVGTPQLLKAFGITPAQVDPNADILTMRPGLAGLPGMQLAYNSGNNKGAGASATPNNPYPCPPGSCLANPVIQQVNALPLGTSAPNTVITERAIDKLGLQSQSSVDGWMIIAPHDPTAAQITSARLAAAQQGMSIETKNSAPTSSEVIGWATVFGLVLALGILAMSVGLIRSETASDLRTLTATGASSFTRRTLTGVTAGGLGFLGALLGVFAGYVGMIGWIRGSSLNGGISALGNVPVNALLVLLIGMPAAATAVGWLFSGRQHASVAHQPME